MKKIFSTLLTILLLANIFSFGNIYANSEKNSHMKNVVLTESQLNKTVKGKKYINTIDSLLEKLSDDNKRLITIQNNIKKLDIDSINNSEIKNVLIYMNSKIFLLIEEDKENEKQEIKNNDVDGNEQEFFEEKIMDFQDNIYSNLEDNLDNFLEKYQENYNVNESGDLNILSSFDYPGLGNFDFNMGLTDYNASTYNFDSEFNGDFELSANGEMAGESFDVQVETFLDMISKEGDIYFMLKDLGITGDQNVEMFKVMIAENLEKINELAEENNYVKFTDNQTQLGIDMIKNIQTENILSDAREYLSQPMLEAYKVEGDKYYTKPTKFACDTAKKLAQKFDPFSPDECSQSQYEDLLEDFSENMEVYFVFDGEETTLNVEGKNENIEESKLTIQFNEEELSELNYDLVNASGEMNLNYQNDILDITADFEQENNIFNMALNADFSDEKLNSFTLDSDYQAKKATVNYETWETTYADEFSNVFDIDFEMENNEISGESVFYYNDQEGVKIISDGNYSENNFEMNNDISFGDDFSREMLMSEDNDFSGNFDINYQEENNSQRTFDVMINADKGDSQIFNFEMTSDYSTSENNSPIEAPTNSVDFEEVFGEVENNIYY